MNTIPTIFDRRLLQLRHERALRLAIPGADFLFQRAADDLGERLSAVQRHFTRAAIIGPDSGALERILAAAQVAETVAVPIEDGPAGEHVAIETGSIDLAVSVLALQWVNDLPGVLAQIRRALKADGLLMAVLIGGETLKELRDAVTTAEVEIRGGAAPRVAPFADVRDLGGLLQRAGLALPVADTDRVTVRYDSLFALARDLRAMGATNALAARDPRPLTRAIAARAAEIYAERYADADGRVRATFELVSISGWAPDPSQPKPLKPGSVTMRLDEAIAGAAKARKERGDA